MISPDQSVSPEQGDQCPVGLRLTSRRGRLTRLPCTARLAVARLAVARLAAEVGARDNVELTLRIALNSGQVIAGEVGSTPLGYTTIGEQVGMAQRMESVASRVG